MPILINALNHSFQRSDVMTVTGTGVSGQRVPQHAVELHVDARAPQLR